MREDRELRRKEERISRATAILSEGGTVHGRGQRLSRQSKQAHNGSLGKRMAEWSSDLAIAKSTVLRASRRSTKGSRP